MTKPRIVRHGASAVIGLLVLAACPAWTHGQGVGLRSRAARPSTEGPGRGTLDRLNYVGFGRADSGRFRDQRVGPTNLLRADRSQRQTSFNTPGGLRAGGGGDYTNALGAPRGRSAQGGLLSPLGGFGATGGFQGRSPGYRGGGRRRGRGGYRFPLPLPGLYTGPIPSSSYLPFAGEMPLAVPPGPQEPFDYLAPAAPEQPDDSIRLARTNTAGEATLVSAESVGLTTIMQNCLDARFAQFSDRGWEHFAQAEYQKALACFRTVEELAKVRPDGRTVQLGLLLAYLADGGYAAAGNQMIALLTREEPQQLVRDELDCWLFDPARREVLERHPNIAGFRMHRERLRVFASIDKKEPSVGLTLCYCLWLEGNATEARETASFFAQNVFDTARVSFTRFLDMLQAAESGRPAAPASAYDWTAVLSPSGTGQRALPRRSPETRDYGSSSGVRAD